MLCCKRSIQMQFEDLTPQEQRFILLWNEGRSLKDIASEIEVDVSTLFRWRQKPNIQLVMNNLSQERYQDSFHKDSIIMDKVRTKVVQEMENISLKDLVWLYQTMTKHQQAKAGPFARNEQELMLQQQSQSIMGSQVEDWIQDSIEKMFNEVMFPEEE
ncbi:MAG: helix-turn-helix domain-containing protein [Candidatus Actinomarina sp.]